MERYESMLEVYQAQNAIQIARSLGADRYAPEIMDKAERLYRDARQLNAAKGPRSTIVMQAREAQEAAEDARTIAVERKHAEELATAKRQVAAQAESLRQAGRRP